MIIDVRIRDPIDPEIDLHVQAQRAAFFAYCNTQTVCNSLDRDSVTPWSYAGLDPTLRHESNTTPEVTVLYTLGPWKAISAIRL